MFVFIEMMNSNVDVYENMLELENIYQPNAKWNKTENSMMFLDMLANYISNLGGVLYK
jgi:hypothetical protein